MQSVPRYWPGKKVRTDKVAGYFASAEICRHQTNPAGYTTAIERDATQATLIVLIVQLIDGKGEGVPLRYPSMHVVTDPPTTTALGLLCTLPPRRSGAKLANFPLIDSSALY